MYADAASAKEQAKSLQDSYSAQMADASNQAAEIIREAGKTAQVRSDEIIGAAKADADAIRSKAQRDIALEKKKAMNDMKDDISGIAVSIAEKVARKEISEQDQQELIASFIDNLGEEA